MLKVLLFSNLYPSLREPTRGMFLHSLFGALSEHCDLRLVSPVPWWSRVRRPAELLSAPRESHTGIDAVFPSYWSIPRYTPMHATGMYWSMRPHVARLHRDFPFDIIVSAWAYPDTVAAAQLARDFNCPLVTRVMGSDINEVARHPRLRRQIQWALNRAHTILAVSSALEEHLVGMGISRDKILMRHNGVSKKQFTVRDRQELRVKLDLPQDRAIICYVGNLKPEKGVDVLVEAMAHLHQADCSDADLVLVGAGELENSLRARAKNLGLESYIHFMGKKPHSEIPDWIGACDIFCLPSRREGCPNVVLECLASGRPVVASAVGGVPELINSENGILVPSGDPAALAAGLKEGLERSWDPYMLRRSVNSPSWEEIGLILYGRLCEAIQDHRCRDTITSK